MSNFIQGSVKPLVITMERNEKGKIRTRMILRNMERFIF